LSVEASSAKVEHVKVDVPTSEIDGLGPLACPKCGKELRARLEGDIAMEKQGRRSDDSYICKDATPEGTGETTLYCRECGWEASA
jgi:uncharacterized protein YbaR (Trm112 family)